MTDKEKKSTMREFAANDQADYYSGITSIVVNGKNAFELKGKFLNDLHKNAFSGTHGEDAIYEWNKNMPWVFEKPWTNTGVWIEPAPVVHCFKPFNYKSGYSEWPTCSWKEDGYCNGGNLPGAYIIGNTLYYQDLEWHDALKDIELKKEALRNKAIMEGLIDEDD
ncbi:hypothetical protein Tco_0093687 [Tanacetum coccineum]